MEFSTDKISMRQAIIFLLLALGAPSLRVIPNYVARDAGKAGWASAIFALIPALILLWTLVSLFKKNEGSLYDIYEKVFGKFLNKIIISLYIVWCIYLIGLYLRMFGERFLNTILFEANVSILMAFMLVFVYFIVNQKIDVVGRMSEILICFFAAIVGLVFLTTVSQIELKNIWPVTYYDTWSIIRGSEPVFSLSCYITAVMFLGDKISNKKRLKKNGIWAMVGWSVFSVILILSTTGLFGHRLNAQLLFPYFATLKNIRILNAIERVESLFISIWVASDAVIIALFSFVSLHLIKRLFKKKSHKKFSLWILVIAFIIAVNFAPNAYEAEEIAKIYIEPVNILFFAGIPILALIVGKIRKVV